MSIDKYYQDLGEYDLYGIYNYNHVPNMDVSSAADKRISSYVNDIDLIAWMQGIKVFCYDCREWVKLCNLYEAQGLDNLYDNNELVQYFNQNWPHEIEVWQHFTFAVYDMVSTLR